MEQQVINIIIGHQKSLDDILYVSFTICDYTNIQVKDYYCTIDEFILYIKNVTCISELHNICDIKIVGHDWWIDYNDKNIPIMHVYPRKPREYISLAAGAGVGSD